MAITFYEVKSVSFIPTPKPETATGISYPDLVIGDSWKTVSDCQICIGGAWKTVTDIQVVESGTWKSLA